MFVMFKEFGQSLVMNCWIIRNEDVPKLRLIQSYLHFVAFVYIRIRRDLWSFILRIWNYKFIIWKFYLAAWFDKLV